MKNFLGGLFSGILISGLIFVSTTVAGNPIALMINDKYVSGDVNPIIINDRVYVPIRIVAETLGCKVMWNASENAVYIYNKNIPQQPNNQTPQPEPLIQPEQTQNYQTQKFGNIEVVVKDSGLKLSNVNNSTNSFGIFGEITNITTNKTYTVPRIIITAYDSSGKAMASEITYPKLINLEPKEMSTFNHYFSGLSLKGTIPNKFKIVIENQNY
jgi:hypothetical protein